MSISHQQRMQKKKAVIDDKIEAATVARGVLVVHTGNGKGKSTAAFGVLARALGHGQRAAVVQFVKGRSDTGEEAFFRQQPGVTWHTGGAGFTWETQDRQADKLAAQTVWQEAKRLLADASVSLVLLDELTYMIAYDYLDLDEVIDALVQRPMTQHVVITGRGCHRALLERTLGL